MEIAIYGFAIGSIILVLWGIVFTQASSLSRIPKDATDVKFQKPKFDFADLFPTGAFLEKSGMASSLKKSLDTAHINMSPGAFFNLKLLLCGLLVVLVISLTGTVNPLIVIIFIILGYIIPDFYLKRKVARRKYLIARRLPETVDLLGLCIEAGLDFVNAVKWVIDRTPHTPMTEELAFVVEEIKWGKPRIQALKDMSRRLEISEITSFVQTIIQAERMGTPVAEAFAILSEDARAQRFHRGERTALQAPIKILLPLIFFIMPVIGIIVGGPILLTFMKGGLTGF
ncbi:MAG: type II secretion system F family protein [Candidatus Omnitrophica bacterium]|jgi:pilus assembly protein TadC|nr:type II secretion system F family protein [Candidatus Omnitrophota bacterium]MDD5661441.1 type II secretion system F family protein [Candidatus Omnitrophota bacterium]